MRLAVRTRREGGSDRGGSWRLIANICRHSLFPKGVVPGNEPGLPFSSCKGRQDACQTEDDGDGEYDFCALQKKGVVLRCNLDPADGD